MGDPIPPTVRDRPRRWPWLALPSALVAGLVVAYFLWWKHPATAHRHVPEGTRLALRADAQALATFGPVREHIWPILFRARGGERSERIERIEKATGLRIPLDLREAVIASVDAQSWVLLVGGPIEPGRFVDGMEEVLREEGASGWTHDGELLVHALGPAIAQADDGTLIVGTGKPIVEASLPAHDGADLPLPPEGAVSFVLHEDAYEGIVDRLPSVPGLDALRDVLPDGVPALSATDAKGLEWDAAVVVDPDGIAAEPRGWNALYVALTRCTQELAQVRVRSL